MKKIFGFTALSLCLVSSPLWAHHPAEDIVDEDIYAMIDENVADTPHASLVFDDMGTSTIITTDSVSDAEELLSTSLLAALSLLGDEGQEVETTADAATYLMEQAGDDPNEEPLTVTITFGDYIEPVNPALVDNEEKGKGNRWTERDDWGRSVQITINRKIGEVEILPDDETTE